jgi:hypothetical protein
MRAFMTVFVDELLWGQTHGFTTVDHSKALDDPARVFQLKVILLFWVGDYPGMSKCAAMKGAGAYGCHWCKGFFYPHSPGHNVCIHNRRHLRKNHPYRKDARWDYQETREPPPLRTTGEVEEVSREISGMNEGPNKARKQKASGISGFCLLLLLDLFDIVWDMLPDMMHIVKGVSIVRYFHVSCTSASFVLIMDYSLVIHNIPLTCVSFIVLLTCLLAGLWKSWFLPMLRGEMLPKEPSEPPVVHIHEGEQVPYTPEEQEVRTAAYEIRKTTWKKTMKVIVVFDMSQIVHYFRIIKSFYQT